MGIQTIINMAESINFDRRKVLGVQYSRNEIARIDETVTRNAWKINVSVSAMLNYENYRGLIEDIDYLDSRYPETVSFSTSTGASAGLSYMLAYQGNLAASDLNALTIVAWTGTSLTLNNLPSVDPSTVMFRKGDFVQAATLPYPTTVSQDVLRGSGSTVTLTTHRPSFMGTQTQGKNILVGNAVEFRVFVNKMPTYTLNSGGKTALLTWSGPFQLYEYTGEV